MNRRRIWAWVALGLSPVLLSGCVYLRLLEIKRQLADFDAHYATSGDPGLTITFKSPTLYAKDVRFLIGTGPLTVKEEGGKDLWHYEFESIRGKASEEEPPLHRLSLGFTIQEGKVLDIEIPAIFLRLFSRRVFVETLRGAAHAQVFKRKKLAKATMKLTPAADAELPTMEKALSLLGAPLERKEEDGRLKLFYQYRIVRDRDDIPIKTWLSFSPDGLLRRVEVTWDTSSIDAVYVRPGETPG